MLSLFALSAMLSSSLRAPSFPPIEEPLEALLSLPWEELASSALSSLLFALALCHALAARLWRERGRLAPLLRSFSSSLRSVADRLPEPLSSSSPRSLLIEALLAHGESSSALAKASRSRLLAKASRLGLL